MVQLFDAGRSKGGETFRLRLQRQRKEMLDYEKTGLPIIIVYNRGKALEASLREG